MDYTWTFNIMFFTILMIARMFCIIFIMIARMTLLIVDLFFGSSSIMFIAMYGTVGIYPVVGGFRRCSYFVDLFCHFYAFKMFTCLLVGLPLKVPSLWVGFI